ncbi:DUF58 domain-containing protein [Shewanella sp. Isolate7]|uniref:DUF58 domain-containing protein n=1 Tax=Shewanella sp. Isolate7 TaxID=2908528 RepID=UPI001EFE490D|nr:DUF58 domain-containing protein [Shewanella sp. Isolate7]MCG9722552.1 DUF58 domain-containing protein [Shewanella sp. Isolate7]
MANTKGKQNRLSQWWQAWIARRLPASNKVTLAHRSIFILPTGFGLFWLLFVVLLFLFGTNYQNNLVIGLSILLLSLFNTCIIYSYRNLAGMTLEAKTGPEAYAGETLLYGVILHAKQVQHQVELSYEKQRVQTLNRIDDKPQEALLPLSNSRRGWVAPGRLRVESRYPLGLCRAWSHLDLANAQIAFAQPKPGQYELSAEQQGDDHQTKERGKRVVGVEEFHGLKPFVTGESLNQIAWKQLAQGRGMLTKEFEQPQSAPQWLTLDTNAPLEEQVSLLTWAADRLSAKGQNFGLKLPGKTLMPGSGEQHRHLVLSTLAVYPDHLEASHGR